MTKPTLAITMGDINGIGPEILAKAFGRLCLGDYCRPVVLGSIAAFDEARRATPQCPDAVAVEDIEEAEGVAGSIPFFGGEMGAPAYRPGILDPEAGRSALGWLGKAVDLAMAGKIDGIVTCPINKEGIHRAGFPFQGHTDFIAERTGALEYRMCLFADTMRIVHLSAHVSLREALERVKKDPILQSIRIGHDALVRLDTATKRIAVAGLNPHAGEAGAFGTEEAGEIAPAIALAQSEGMDCSGPYPADTVFGRMRDGEFDLVVAMYHDQGHIPLKLAAWDEGVNVTLGIPIVRTSVDHGTAYDIAGRNMAREDSLCAAVRLAAQLAGTRGRGTVS